MSLRRFNLVLAGIGIAALFAALALGATPLPLGRVLGGAFGMGEPGDAIVIWDIRAPRALSAFIVGASLGAAGAALQGYLRNPLAEPGVLGVSATATLFATISVYWGVSAAAPLVTPLAAIAGALAATALLAIAAARQATIVSLILIGVGLSSFAGAVLALLMNLAPNPFSLSDMINWTLGSVANRSFEDLALSAPFIIVGLGVLLSQGRNLSALTLGEEAAAGLGVDLKRARLFIIAGAGLATGASVALAGAIGFVGLVAPHIVRPFAAYDPARTLVPSALAGGVLLLTADIIVRLTPTANELKLGVIAALIGAPMFIWIAARRGTA